MSSSPRSPLFAELKRSRVFRAILAYGVAAFAVLQIIEPIMHGLHWPDAVLSYLVAALAIGFPIVVAVAWAFDVHAGQAERTPPDRALPRSRLAAVLIGIGLFAAAAELPYYFISRRVPQRTDAERSVAILPFQNLSTDKDNEFFAEGIHSELITQLGKVSGLKVIARGSVEHYRDGARDLKAIGEALGVSTLVEGSVQRIGGRVRIAAQLVDAATSRELWSDRYDRNIADTFAIQTDVALDIAHTLGAKLTEGEKQLVRRQPTKDDEAYDLYLRGLYYWQRSWAEADNLAAKTFFEKAVARDPSFALAMAMLSSAEIALHDPDCAKGHEHADLAIALQPDLAEAHAALSTFQSICRGDIPAAIREARSAVERAPNNAALRRGLAGLQLSVGDEHGGLESQKLACELDPLAAYLEQEYAFDFILLGRFDEAEKVAARAREIDPHNQQMVATSVMIPMYRNGDFEEARLAFARMYSEGQALSTASAWAILDLPEQFLAFAAADRIDGGGVERARVCGLAHFVLGHDAEAKVCFNSMLHELEIRQNKPLQMPTGLSHNNLALAYSGLGRADDAFTELQAARALNARDFFETRAMVATMAGRHDEALAALTEALDRPSMYTAAYLRASRFYGALRRDPRFGAMLAKHEKAKAP